MNEKLKLFLISNSKNHGDTEWLGWVKKDIQEFLDNSEVTKGSKILFVDFAGKHIPGLGGTPEERYKAYLKKAEETFPEYKFISAGLELIKMNEEKEKQPDLKWQSILNYKVSAVFVAGGNTWTLAENVFNSGLFHPLQGWLLKGMPYVGWSAGAILACSTICTTNDMCSSPQAAMRSDGGLDLVPFQINPHYVDGNPDKVGGETREDRILEYIQANKDTTIIGLREGCACKMWNGDLSFIGERPIRIFDYGIAPIDSPIIKGPYNFLLGA